MKKLLLSLTLVLSCLAAKADEGMWLICNLSQRTDSILKSMGLELSREELYNPDGPCLNNAIVSFGGYCSGVVVSPEGLVFTNHHCGFSSIQEHSTTKNNYLRDGFFAKRQKDELPNPDLYVDFHLRTVDVTDKVLGPVPSIAGEDERADIVDSICNELSEAVRNDAEGIYGEVTPFYKGSKYYLSVYQRYSDVRLVFAPPQCLGKFGGDTDNWMWPRQTCDFSVFRIYAGKDNKPAEYSADNVPYRAASYAHVSTQGYQPGSYCMTLGYPGSTDRYLSSYGIQNTMNTTNALRIKVRDEKLAIYRDAMNTSDALRIMYASKYAQSSNYWKFSIGQNKALKDLGVIEEKQALEQELRDWANEDVASRAQYIAVLDTLKALYEEDFDRAYNRQLWSETFGDGSEVLMFALQSMIGRISDEEGGVTFSSRVQKAFKDIDVETDKKVFAAMAKMYCENVKGKYYRPDFYMNIVDNFDGDYTRYTEDLYAKSVFSQPERLAEVDSLQQITNDPMFTVASDILTLAFTLGDKGGAKAYERTLGEGIRLMNHDREYYPDANFTLRLSYGMVNGYSPSEALSYIEYTEPQSLIDKNEKNPTNRDYELVPSVYKWLKKGSYGKQYVDKKSGEMQLCFLSNNDITGGNSGSGMFDGKGRLIGLAFDGNWEAMSGDLKFDTKLQRCIGVDIRFVLSVIDKYGKAKRLINELTLE